MMNTSLSIQPPRWVLAFLVLGMVLVVIDLAVSTNRRQPEQRMQAAQPPRVAVQQRTAVQAWRPQTPTRPSIATTAYQPPRYNYKRIPLGCGCTVDYSDGLTPPCSIRFTDGAVLLFDGAYRADTLAGGRTRLTQFRYDDQDRVVSARYDPENAVYYFNKDGSLKEISHYVHGRRPEIIKPSYRIEHGARTRYPHELAHPHVAADSAMGHVLAGTWKAFGE